MSHIYESVMELVGNTPLVALNHIAEECCPGVRLLAKLECRNPAGSAKDRVGLHMLKTALESGTLKPGGILIEPTSGNTGIALAAAACGRDLRVIIVMPDNMSEERKKLMRAYGAELVLTPGSEGMNGAIRKAEELRASLPGSVIAGQFVNPANPEAHYLTTGPEIWRDTDGRVDVFVAAAGTGGTVTGTARYLKEQNPAIRVVAAEPAGSPVLSGGKAGKHRIQGIGAGFIPEILDTSLLDEVIPITDQEAYDLGRELAKREGLLAGISSGAALAAAIRVAQDPEWQGKQIVVIFPDSGERYLSDPDYYL